MLHHLQIPLHDARKPAAPRDRSPYFILFVYGLNGVLSVGLALLGVGGLGYKLLAPEGWIVVVLGERWAVPEYLNIALSFAAVCVVAAAWPWICRNQSLRKHGDVPLYLFMALGLYFLFQLISTGAL